MTYEELTTYAMEHYDEGGDVIVECWDKKTFDFYVKEFGKITKAKADKMFAEWKDEIDDMWGW